LPARREKKKEATYKYWTMRKPKNVPKNTEGATIEDAKKALDNTQKVHVLAGLPEYLKDPANYQKIRKAIYETIATKHSHSDILEWGACVNCQIKLKEHGELIRRLGFTCPEQYRAWLKVHAKIEERVKLR